MLSPEALGLAAYYCHGVKDAAETAMQMKANESSGTALKSVACPHRLQRTKRLGTLESAWC